MSSTTPFLHRWTTIVDSKSTVLSNANKYWKPAKEKHPLFSFAPTADTTLLIYRTCIAATVRYFTCPSNTDFCRHIGHFCNGERLTWVANAPSGVMTLSACDFVTPTLLRLFITKGQFRRVSYDLAVVVVVVVFPYDRCDRSTRFRAIVAIAAISVLGATHWPRVSLSLRKRKFCFFVTLHYWKCV